MLVPDVEVVLPVVMFTVVLLKSSVFVVDNSWYRFVSTLKGIDKYDVPDVAL